ncbi:hypothetical protein JW848_08700 [Candidatus Bipolaricaulota bacterium]|nr:hypothetical protein [Candidatus Bipolaricaulota bacterium]
MMIRIETRDDLLNLYRTQTETSGPAPYASAYEGLPQEIPALCRLLQNNMIHMWWIGEQTYGFTRQDLAGDGRDIISEISLRTAADMLGKMLEFDPRPLTEARDARQRLVGNCRDYTLLLVSSLRHRRIPARARTGTARYFFPDGSRLEDHWICEFWNEAAGRWQQTDPQIDNVMRKAMKLPFDPSDLPPGQFLTGWQCYDELQSGRVEPKAIGFPPDHCGMGYVLHKMLADLASLTGQEVLPWAGWGIGGPDGGTLPGDHELAQRMAELLKGIDQPAVLQEARELMASHERLKRPDGYDPGPFQEEWLGD